jgi:hypothetical protein
VTKHVYEINVRGPVSAGLLAELGARRRAVTPTETVLITTRLGPDQLHTIVGRIADLGLDVREVRRVPRPPAPGAFTTRRGHR